MPRRFVPPTWSVPIMMLALCLLYGRAPPLSLNAGFNCEDRERLSKVYSGSDQFPTKWLLVGSLVPQVFLVGQCVALHAAHE